MPARRRVEPAAGRAAVAAWLSDPEGAPHETTRDAVRFLLDELAVTVPGKAVEVRVPPYAAVQCVAGPRHTRGTPPNVVETDARTWIELATGRLRWAEALRGARVAASGERADLSPYLPVERRPHDRGRSPGHGSHGLP
jgi:hypothetical protein